MVGLFILCKADLFGDFFLLISNSLGVILRCDSKSALGRAIEMTELLFSARCRACSFFIDYYGEAMLPVISLLLTLDLWENLM